MWYHVAFNYDVSITEAANEWPEDHHQQESINVGSVHKSDENYE
jgi:hypothetical protein